VFTVMHRVNEMYPQVVTSRNPPVDPSSSGETTVSTATSVYMVG